MKDSLFFVLFSWFGKSKAVNFIFKKIYLFTFKAIKFYFVSKFKSITCIFPRNSITSDDFTFLLSDLDFTILVRDESEIDLIANKLINIKKILIFIDFPEIYLESEYLQYLSLNPSKYQPYLDLCWHIRKIHWLRKKMSSSISNFEIFKLNKSLQRSFKKIFNDYSADKKEYQISDFKAFANYLPSDKSCCYLSPYLEINHESPFLIALSKKEFEFFNTIMPRETIPYYHMDEIPLENLRIKQVITFNEYLISKTSINMKKQLGVNFDSNIEWCKDLHNDLVKIQQIVTSSHNIQ